MTTPLAIFDLDGTLLDTAPDLTGALNRILGEEGLGPVDPAVVRSNVGHGARAILAAGFRLAGEPADEARIERLVPRYLEIYTAAIAAETRPFPGLVPVLDALSAAGVRLAVCTNKRHGPAVRLLEALGLAPRFAAIVGGDSLPVRKPDPGHILGTMDRAGGHPAATVMIGDSDADILAARGAGIKVVACRFGYSPVPVERFSPDAIIDGYGELPAVLARLSPVFAPAERGFAARIAG